MPLTRRIPKRGFTNPFRVEYQVVRARRPEPRPDGDEITPESLAEAGLIRARQGSGEAARQRRDLARGHRARREGQRRRAREDRRGRRPRRGVTIPWRKPIPPRRLANIYQDAGAVGEDHLHVPVPADLPRRRAHHGAGRRRHRADGLLQQPGQSGGLLGLYDLFVGGGLSRATVFALGIMPYISASIFMQIAGAVIPTVDKMQKDEEGRKKLTSGRATSRWCSRSCRRRASRCSRSRCRAPWRRPGFGFTLQMVLFLTTGAMFVMWLGEQITERGLGNGASLLIFFSIVERFWPGIFETFQLREHGRDRRRSRCSCSALVMVGGRGRRGGDHAGRAARRDPDPAAHDGAGPHARGGEELHPAAHQLRGRDADHLRAVGDRGAGRVRAVQRQPSGAAISPTYFAAGHGAVLHADRRS